MEPVAEIIRRVVHSAQDLNLGSLAVLCAETGWAPMGVTYPFPRKWSYGKLQLSIFSEGEDDFLEFIFEVIPPDWEFPEYAEAADGDYSPQIGRFHRIRDDLLVAIHSEISTEEISEAREDSVDFIESGCWKIGRGYLSVGVAHADEDSPILLLARLRQS